MAVVGWRNQRILPHLSWLRMELGRIGRIRVCREFWQVISEPRMLKLMREMSRGEPGEEMDCRRAVIFNFNLAKNGV